MGGSLFTIGTDNTTALLDGIENQPAWRSPNYNYYKVDLKDG